MYLLLLACCKPIHLMSINDFEKMGIALADARMLCQRFRDTEKVRKLAEIMLAARSGHSFSVSTKVSGYVTGFYDGRRFFEAPIYILKSN